MAYISLYRKYRPHKFSDVVGQEVVVNILKNSIVENKIGHAYIFSGPRGTGKTSIAKIFAKAVNCLNNKNGDVCEECDVCNKNQIEDIDIVEIDAASNNGVDEIREIRNNAKLLPSVYKYKVYIVDEVHMLSTSAFNALLKTLEEPPAHVIFILATTEFNKIPITVVSRCQKFDFKKIKNTDIINRLKYILEKENRTIDDEIVEFIAKISDGGLRDAINLLDQILSLNKENIKIEDAYLITGYIEDDSIYDLLKQMFDSNTIDTLKYIEEYAQTDKNYTYLCNKMIDILKNILIFISTNNYFSEKEAKKLSQFVNIPNDKIVNTIEILLELRNELKKSSDQKILVEVYFLKILLLFNNNLANKGVNKGLLSKENNEIEVKNGEKEENVVKKENSVVEKESNNECNDDLKKIKINNAFYGANKELKGKFIDKYDEISDYLSVKEYASLANLLQKATPEVVSDKNLIFTFKKDIDSNLFNINIEEIQKLLKLIYKKKYSVIAVTDEEWKKLKEEYIFNMKNNVKYEYIEEKVKKKRKTSELQTSIENIFGDEYIREE